MAAIFNVRHSAATPEWGTTPLLASSSRLLMGGIDCDPASSALWNRTIRATTFYTKKQNGLLRQWLGRILLNPPGDKGGRLVQAFWLRLIESYLAGDVQQAVWVGFSLDQLVSLQGILDEERNWHVPWPLSFPSVVPWSRVRFLEQKGRRTSRSTRPSHGNYVTWLPPLRMSREVAWAKFIDVFGPLGQVSLPHRDYGEAIVSARALDKQDKRSLADVLQRRLAA